MIAVDALELQTRLAQTVIHIRNKEVALFTDQFGVLAGTATFLASLGFGALTMSTNFLGRGDSYGEYCSDLIGCDRLRNAPGRGYLFNNFEVITVYFTLTTLGIACNFACVMISMYSMIFGPELAIRGREHEQKRAIRGMYAEREVALNFFWAGCAFIVLSGATLGWLKYPKFTGLILTLVFTVLLAGAVLYIAYDLYPRFDYVDAEGLDCSHFGLWHMHADSRDASLDGEPRPPRWSLLAAAGLAGRAGRAPAPAPADDGDADDFYATHKSGPLSVDGERRHALLGGGALRVFDLDGAEVDAVDLAGAAVDLARDGGAFALVAGGRRVTCAGADLADTQHWIRALALATDADGVARTFSDCEDDAS